MLYIVLCNTKYYKYTQHTDKQIYNFTKRAKEKNTSTFFVKL